MKTLLIVCLAVISSCLFHTILYADICTDVEEETGLDLNEAECYVLEQVEKGEVAHFKMPEEEVSFAAFQERFSKIKDRTLSADFLEDLLTGNLPSLKVTEEGVRIWYAGIKEPFYLQNTIIPFPVSLSLCIFDKEVNFYKVRFDKEADFIETKFSEVAAFHDATFSGEASFKRATFSGDAVFRTSKFSGKVSFREATFFGEASFGAEAFGQVIIGAKFSEEVFFSEATFSGDASFQGATFSGNVSFYDATFSGKASFFRVKFSGEAGFDHATFSGEASFGLAKFSGLAYFDGATFVGNAYFWVERGWITVVSYGATFSGEASFFGVKFSGEAGFDHAEFSEAAFFKRSTFSGRASFSQVTFLKEADFSLCSFKESINFRKVIFPPDRIPLIKFADVTGFSNMHMEWEYNPEKFGTEEDDKKVKRRGLKGHLEHNETFYIALIKNYRDMGWFQEADDCYYTYRVDKRNNRLKGLNNQSEDEENGPTSFSRLWNKAKLYGDWLLLDLTFGYGVRPDKISITFFAFWIPFSFYYLGFIRKYYVQRLAWWKAWNPFFKPSRFLWSLIYSLDNLTPGVSFESLKSLKKRVLIKSDSKRILYVKRFQQILGWYWAALFLILFSKIWIR